MSPLPGSTWKSTAGGLYGARVLADSKTNSGIRLTTFEATFPRFLLAEVNTHRVFSRNSASSRAIPTERLIERVRESPFVPATFNKRVKGMGVGEVFSERDIEEATGSWMRACEDAVREAEFLANLGLDKSRANRLLEPFMWHTAIITSTEWENFYALRCPDGDQPDPNFPAQLEFQQIAILMRQAAENSNPVTLRHDQWHTPLIVWEEAMEQDLQQFGAGRMADAVERVLSVCARHLARVSFDRHMEDEQYTVSVSKTGELVAAGHFSPTEHIARPLSSKDTTDPKIAPTLMMPVSQARAYRFTTDTIWSGNLRGWYQWRKKFPYENNHRLALENA